MIRWLVGAIGLSVVATRCVRGRSGRDRHRLSRPRRRQGEVVAGRAAGRERRHSRRASRDRGQQHHRQVPQSAFHPGGGSAQGWRRRCARRRQRSPTATGFIIADLPADALLKAADALRDRGTVLFNAGAIDDRLREAGLPRQCHPCCADAFDAGGCACPISGVEAVEALAAGGRLARGGQALCRRAAARRRRALAPRSCRSACSRIPAAPAAPTAA